MEIEKENNSGWVHIPFKYIKKSMNNVQASKIPPSTATIIDKGDMDSYSYYFSLVYIEALQDVVAEIFGPAVDLPNTYTITSNATGQLSLS